MEKGLGYLFSTSILISSIQPISSIVISISKDSEYIGKKILLFNKSTSLFQNWKLSVMKLGVQFHLAVTIIKFLQQKDHSDNAYVIMYNKHAGL